MLPFGKKHQGKTLMEIYMVDPAYLVWIAGKVNKEPAWSDVWKFYEELGVDYPCERPKLQE